MTAARLAWRMQRWELLVLVGGSLVLAAVMTLIAWQAVVTLEGLDACYRAAAGALLSASCRSRIEWGNLITAVAQVLPSVAVGLPFVIGILLGAPLVAREIENRTAPIAWSLSRSRRRWLAGRLIPVVLAVAVALLAVGAASEALLEATREAGLGFMDFGAHGPLIAARGLAVLGIGVVLGLVVGRVLPAVLVTGLMALTLVIGLQLARDAQMRADAEWVDAPTDSSFSGMVYDSAWTDDATGDLVTYDEAFARHPEVFGPEGNWLPPGMTQVYLTTPPELYPAFVAREAAALAGIAFLAGGTGAWVVAWRRPE